MNDVGALKLKKALGVNYEVALALVEAGLVTENQAREASEETLTAISGIDETLAEQIRSRRKQ